MTENLYQENVGTFIEDAEIIETQQRRLEMSPNRSLLMIHNDETIVKCHTALRRFIAGEVIS